MDGVTFATEEDSACLRIGEKWAKKHGKVLYRDLCRAWEVSGHPEMRRYFMAGLAVGFASAAKQSLSVEELAEHLRTMNQSR